MHHSYLALSKVTIPLKLVIIKLHTVTVFLLFKRFFNTEKEQITALGTDLKPQFTLLQVQNQRINAYKVYTWKTKESKFCGLFIP